MKKYSKDHEWLKAIDNNRVEVGISDYAQDSLGDIVYVNLPEIGDTVEAGEVMGDIESIKAVSDLISPVTGEVTEINEEILDAPEQLNSDAENTWLVRVTQTEAPKELMDVETYQAYLKTL